MERVVDVIHLFHGFLGSPADFAFLAHHPEIKIHDLYQIDLHKITDSISDNDVLIGYSMGGRLALQLAAEKNFQIKKLILINAHPGLAENEKAARAVWEDKVLHKLYNEPLENFLEWWNSLAVFKADQPILCQQDKNQSAMLFESMRLSQQSNYLPLIIENKEKVLWIIGAQDEKYLALSDTHLKPHAIPHIVVSGGHRLFQKPESLLPVLKAQGIL